MTEPVEKPKTKYPVDNDKLREEILKSQELDRMTDRAGLMLKILIENLQKKFKYRDSDMKYECYAQGMMHCLNAFRKYDQNISENCFAWFTSVAWHGLCDGMNKFRKSEADYSIDQIFEQSI